MVQALSIFKFILCILYLDEIYGFFVHTSNSVDIKRTGTQYLIVCLTYFFILKFAFMDAVILVSIYSWGEKQVYRNTWRRGLNITN